MVTLTKEKKITLATVKSFIKQNKPHLHIKRISDFDGMVDMVVNLEDHGFRPVIFNDPMDASMNEDHTLGVKGAWFVLRSNDGLRFYENDGFIGIEVYNSCGNFIIAVPKVLNF